MTVTFPHIARPIESTIGAEPDTCPACEGRGFVSDGDEAEYCTAPGCTAWLDVDDAPDDVSWEDEFHPGTRYTPYVLPELLPRGTAQVA